MNELLEIVSERNGVPITTSLIVAEKFEKSHDNVLKAIRALEKSLVTFNEPNLAEKNSTIKFFRETTYKNRGKKYPMYEMDRDGFSLLVMGFNGEKALRWKIGYIKAFDTMEEYIRSIQSAKLDYPAFTRAIEQAHEEPKFYHFSNEINMINRIVLGTDAKHFKEENGIDKEENSIRPYLTAEQIRAIEELQRIDIGLLVANIEFEQRKQIIKSHYEKRICNLEVKT